ncbi:unnamed protein product [Ectocarpus sp. 12 AP-2014]
MMGAVEAVGWVLSRSLEQEQCPSCPWLVCFGVHRRLPYRCFGVLPSRKRTGQREDTHLLSGSGFIPYFEVHDMLIYCRLLGDEGGSTKHRRFLGIANVFGLVLLLLYSSVFSLCLQRPPTRCFRSFCCICVKCCLDESIAVLLSKYWIVRHPVVVPPPETCGTCGSPINLSSLRSCRVLLSKCPIPCCDGLAMT